MRNFMQLVTVGASAFAAIASASSGQRPYEDQTEYAVVPPLVRNQIVRGQAVGGIEIDAKPYGAVSWQLAIRNTTDAMVSVKWDESTFVTSNGASVGRLIRGETRKIDISNAQPATPVAPGSMISEVVIPEKGADSEEDEAAATAHTAMPKAWIPRVLRRRESEARLLVGGKLVITLDAGGKPLTWTGVVESTDTSVGSAAKGSDLEQP